MERRTILWLSCSLSMLVGWTAICAADEALDQRASWEWPTTEKVRVELDEWLADQELSDDQLAEIAAAWDGAQVNRSLLMPLLAAASAAQQELALFVASCQSVEMAPSLAEFDQLAAPSWPPLVTNNLRLLYGKSLAIHRLYDEALTQLNQLQPDDVADPATLLFYRAAARYRLRDAEAAASDLKKLLERESEIPVRYATVANLMLADLKQFKPDSLDEVARIMDSIKVRLGHGRAGKRVRDEEQEVIDKLSKMIEELEQQLQQMQAAAQSGAGGNQSSNPAQDSMLPGGGGPGDVDPRKLGEETEWGDLPPLQRKQALQELGEEFPSHYRDVIEEYFRSLAREAEDS